MKKTLLILLALCLLPGWTCATRAPLPVEAQCDQMCFVECKSEAKWEGDSNDPAAWDQLAGETVPALRAETRTCEVRRKACEQCLKRLERHGVIYLED